MRAVQHASFALCACLALFGTGCPTTYIVLTHDGGAGTGAVGMQPAGEGGAGWGGASGVSGASGIGGSGGCEDGACGGTGGCGFGGAAGCNFGGAGGVGGCGSDGCGTGGTGVTGGVGGGPACDPGAGGMAANNCAMTCSNVGETWIETVAPSGHGLCTVLEDCSVDCIWTCNVTPDDPRCLANVGGMAAAGVGGMAGTSAGMGGMAGCDTSDPACTGEPVPEDAGAP